MQIYGAIKNISMMFISIIQESNKDEHKQKRIWKKEEMN